MANTPLSMAVADLGEVPEGAGPPYCLTRVRPKGPKKIILETAPPPLSQGLDDRAPSLSEGLDPPMYRVLRLNRCLSQAA